MQIVLQRGHVPRTSGKTGAPGEQAFATEAAWHTERRLIALGHQVRVINADEPVYRYAGDLFAALHYDSSTSPSVRGASFGYQTEAGRELADLIRGHYVNNGWTGGFRPDNYTPNLAGYYGVRHAIDAGNTRAVIIEAGFHSNPDDAALLAPPAGADRIALAIAGAVVDLTGCHCPPNRPPIADGGYNVPPTLDLRNAHLTPVRTTSPVRKLQGLLNAHSYGTTIDGVAGAQTQNDVRRFQRDHELKRDTIVGPVTWRELIES